MNSSESFEPTLLIIAAGLGSRYGSLKQIDQVGPSGERIIDYSLFDSVRAGFKNVVYVIRESFKDEFEEVILDKIPTFINATYVFQEVDSLLSPDEINPLRIKPWGTGHALLTASTVIKSPFVVINADDFYGQKSYEIAYKFLKNNSNKKSSYALIGFELVNTMSKYGTVSRAICSTNENEFLTSIIERTKIKWDNYSIVYEDEENKWNELNPDDIVSMNMFAFMPSVFEKGEVLFKNFLSKNKYELNTEFYLPEIVDDLIKSQQVKVKVLQTPEQWFGLTYKEDKNVVRKKIFDLVKKGIYPEKLWG